MFIALIIFYVFFMLIMLAIPVAAYVLSALGLSRMAKSCGLKSPYLAWIPVGDMYLIGSIAEIGASREGKKPLPFRKILPGLSAGIFAVLIAMMVALFALAFSEAAYTDPDDTENVPGGSVEYVSYSLNEPEYDIDTDEEYDEYSDEYYDDDSDAFSVSMFLLIMLFYLLLIGVAIATTVFQYLALWYVYKLFDESNAVLYLVLSILLSASPVIFFILGRKAPPYMPMTADAKMAAAIQPTGTSVAAISAAMASQAPEAPAPEAPAEQLPVDSGADNQF